MRTAIFTVLGYVFAALCVAVCLCSVWLFLPMRRRVRDGGPAGELRTWDEWVGDAEAVLTPDTKPDRSPTIVVTPYGPPVIVLGVPGKSHRMVCRACVQARADGRFDDICQPCAPLLVSQTRRA